MLKRVGAERLLVLVPVEFSILVEFGSPVNVPLDRIRFAGTSACF